MNHHNRDAFSPQKFDFKAPDIFPGSFTWIYLGARFKWHSRTLGDFDFRWTLAFRHGKVSIYCSHWNFQHLAQCFQITHILYVMNS